MLKSRYTLLVEGLSSVTRSADIRAEFERAGKVLEVVRDPKHRCAIVEFDRAADAKWAWDKMDGIKVDGRTWKLDYATVDDFRFFEKTWTEGGLSKSKGRSRTPSPMHSRGDNSRPLSDQTPY